MKTTTSTRSAESNAKKQTGKQQTCRYSSESDSMKHLHNYHFYCYLAAKEAANDIVNDIKDEMFDGIFIELNHRNNNKNNKQKKRILRKHAEKLAGQAVHKHIGRREGRFPNHQIRSNVSRIMFALENHQHCC